MVARKRQVRLITQQLAEYCFRWYWTHGYAFHLQEMDEHVTRLGATRVQVIAYDSDSGILLQFKWLDDRQLLKQSVHAQLTIWELQTHYTYDQRDRVLDAIRGIRSYQGASYEIV